MPAQLNHVLLLGVALSATLAHADDPGALEASARLHHWRGEAPAARHDADLAEKLAPPGPELVRLGDAILVQEMRLSGRATRSHEMAGLAFTQAGHRWQLTARTEQLHYQRYNGLYAVEAALAPAIGWRLSAELGGGSPAPEIPSLRARLQLEAPLVAALDGRLAYAHWRVRGDGLHIINPAVGLSVTDSLRLEARYWLVLAQGEQAHSVMGQVRLRPGARLELGIGYGYGVELERSPLDDGFLDLRQHTMSLFADWRLSRNFGLTPLVLVEHRGGQWIPTVEVPIYARR
jgi:YaiO family outer membrane protein